MCGESIGAITFGINDLERSMSLRFRRSRKGAELDHVLLLNTSRKSHMGSPAAPSHLTLSDHSKVKFKVTQTLKAYRYMS